MNNNNSILSVENLAAGYEDQLVLENVTFQLEKGEVLGIIGQNGSGKSTLLKTINGLIPKKGGAIQLKDIKVKNVRTSNLIKKGISTFAQSGLIMPALSVEEHLSLAVQKSTNSNGRGSFQDAYDAFPQLEKIKEQRAGSLSGGQRQMLSFAILIVQNTNTWLLDEPTAGLSPENVEQTTLFLQKMNREKNITMLLIEHNMSVAFQLSDNIAITKNKTLTRKFSQQEFNEDNFLNNYVYN